MINKESLRLYCYVRVFCLSVHGMLKAMAYEAFADGRQPCFYTGVMLWLFLSGQNRMPASNIL